MARTLESSTEAGAGLRHLLMEVRRGLLGLHKALIVAEQLTYERINGRVGSTGQLLQLVLNDPWFTWLHPLSQLVIRVDELLEEGEELTTVEVEHFLADVRALIRPSEVVLCPPPGAPPPPAPPLPPNSPHY
jgi:hypothetical protein